MCQKESRSSQVTESMVKNEADCGVAGGGGEFQRHHFGPWRIKELTQILRRIRVVPLHYRTEGHGPRG